MERGTRRMKITFPFTFPSRRVATKRTGRSRSRKFFRRLTEENEKKKKEKRKKKEIRLFAKTEPDRRIVLFVCEIGDLFVQSLLPTLRFPFFFRALVISILIPWYFSYGIRLTQPTLLQVKEGLDLLMRKVYYEIFRFLLQVFLQGWFFKLRSVKM